MRPSPRPSPVQREREKSLPTTRVAPTSSYTNFHGRVVVALAILILAALVVASGARTAIAQSGGGYDLTWNTIDGGGVTFSTGGTFSLGGTIGQPDAGAMSGGTYSLSGGFWVDFPGNRLYLPIIQK